LYGAAVTTGNGYTNVAWPTTNVTTTLSLNYYDGYTMPGLPSAYTAPTGANLSTRGELTGTQTDVLGSSNMLWTGHYYDYWGRSLESYAQHYLNGTLNSNNYDAITTTYSFTNQPTTVTRKHWTSASTSYPLVTIYNKYLYDQVDRKLKTWEQITNTNLAADTLRLVSQAHYNEIGQVYSKQLHSKDSVNFIQTIGYYYNERGWLTQASAPLFDVAFYYNTLTNKGYNGNIMYQYWGVPGNLNNHYTYKYDKLNRLLSGVTSLDNYQESGIAYDTEGNLTTLNRYQAGTEIDQLSYTYTVSSNPTNQLQSVTDANASNTGLVSGTTNYTYDGNGNMLTATNTVNTGQNKSISYNLLNLPLVVTVPTGTDTYTYDAKGNKLRRVAVIGGVTTNTDYIGGIQYSGTTSESIAFIQTEEGKAVPNGTTNYDYNYYLADNLGNTRVTFGTKTAAAILYQQDDYYPFGLEITRTAYNPKNEYLYNKKELQEDFTEYDYGARFYDPVLVHWNTIDPLAEVSRRWSPYSYVEDDPIRLTDPDGMMTDKEVEDVQQEEADDAAAGRALNGRPGEAKEEQTPSKPQTLTVDKKALDPSTTKTTTHSEDSKFGDSPIGQVAGLIAHNVVYSETETNTTTSTGTAIDPYTGQEYLTSSTITVATTVSIDITENNPITSIQQATSLVTMSTPIISENKNSAVLDVGATKTVNWGTTIQAVSVKSLSAELKANVREAIFEEKVGTSLDVKFTNDNLKDILDGK